jgi:hypothetical protein
MDSSTLNRWLNENVADTRRSGPPSGRRYAVPFARVWDEMCAIVDDRWGWEMAHADETRGLATVTCRTPVLPFVDDLAIWVSLDDDGFTRVEARSRSRIGKGDLGVNRRRIQRLLRHLDDRLGID